jgi:heme-degrading monooxygenase HmoA
MARVISIHEYELRPSVQEAAFERALHDAESRGLFDLPGLIEHHFLRGMKGARRGAYTAIWIFESREAWEKLWGTVEAPRPVEEYPETWKIWENEILAPFLIEHPDTIRFTSYEEIWST